MHSDFLVQKHSTIKPQINLTIGMFKLKSADMHVSNIASTMQLLEDDLNISTCLNVALNETSVTASSEAGFKQTGARQLKDCLGREKSEDGKAFTKCDQHPVKAIAYV